MSHLFNNLGHRLANTTKKALSAILLLSLAVFAIYILANPPITTASGLVVAGFSSYKLWCGLLALITALACVVFYFLNDHGEHP